MTRLQKLVLIAIIGVLHVGLLLPSVALASSPPPSEPSFPFNSENGCCDDENGIL
jgi:hypothetical protein